MLPFDFIIRGTPLSQQAKGRNRQRWKAKVHQSARVSWPSTDRPLSQNLKLTIVYYHDGSDLDTDNMVKPIQDSLIGLIYDDDQWVTDVSAHKRDINGSYRVRGISPALADGFSSGGEFVHVKVEAAPNTEVLL